jgi:hypothetical protein
VFCLGGRGHQPCCDLACLCWGERDRDGSVRAGAVGLVDEHERDFLKDAAVGQDLGLLGVDGDVLV